MSPYWAAVAKAVVYAPGLRSGGMTLKPRRNGRGAPSGFARMTVGPGVGAPFDEHAEKIIATSASAATMANAGNGRLRPGAAMRAFFLVAILSGVFIGTAVAGVRALTRDGGEGRTRPPRGPRPRRWRVIGDAARGLERSQAVAGEYGTALRDADGPSQASVPLGSFTAEYTTFATELTLRTLVAKVASADGASAKLTVHAATAYFGDFEYSTTLNLSKTGGRWFVAWSPAVIHPDLAGGRHFKSSIQRAARGSILDRNGAPLAVTKEIRFLGLNRSVVQDRAALTATLGELGFTKDQVDAAFNAPGGATQRVTVGPVADGMVEAAALAVRSLPGAILYFESQRVHPLGGAAAHVVGYTREFTAEELDQRRGQGYRVGDRVGATGLEASLEKRLAGQHGAELRLVESDNTPSFAWSRRASTSPGRMSDDASIRRRWWRRRRPGARGRGRGADRAPTACSP
jgi:hypothetical protein